MKPLSLIEFRNLIRQTDSFSEQIQLVKRRYQTVLAEYKHKQARRNSA